MCLTLMQEKQISYYLFFVGKTGVYRLKPSKRTFILFKETKFKNPSSMEPSIGVSFIDT